MDLHLSLALKRLEAEIESLLAGNVDTSVGHNSLHAADLGVVLAAAKGSAVPPPNEQQDRALQLHPDYVAPAPPAADPPPAAPAPAAPDPVPPAPPTPLP
jgi:hypothetical protein